ncbi:hypothetical protein GSI_01970 [Ganoderma sinense ZZ0214-1]|uniref:Uncharacterized protein n=1 Tax=Ganoderma sinense ZZ0214-1 TaxID=1077348 RepID=A0A2G8SRB4_9APHY|nr:hypothetical protein GSI_01970 [Ganoderma sinense ZZ0214-1]
MPEPLITVGECEPTVMYPIKIFKSTFLFLSLCFGTTDHDSLEKCHVCCISQHANPKLPLPKTPVVFSLYGQIAVEDCFLTTRGHLQPMDEELVALCWLEACPNVATEIHWRSIMPTIKAIIEKYGGEVDPSHLLTWFKVGHCWQITIDEEQQT